MYIPKAFEETRLPVLHGLIQAQPFSSLITLSSAGLLGSHLPMVLDPAVSRFGILKGHLSRANPQWRDISPDVQALAIFAGPQHYITPTWYPEKQEHGKVVPTWNYAVVHAYGHLRVIEDPTWLLDHLQSLTNIHEAPSPNPWKVDDAPADFIQTMTRGIVGLELAIDRLEGKWKTSQNRSERDRQGVVNGLEELGTPSAEAMKALVQKTL